MKAKLITAAALTLAGLGAMASREHPAQGPQRSGPAPAEHPLSLRSEGQPVETPLVEKLLPAVPKSLRAKSKSGLSSDDVVRIYSENEAEISAIWLSLDESGTMRDAVEEWVKRQSEPATIRDSRTVQDGQLSPGGQWRWSKAQWAWVPVKQAGPAWVQDGHSATISHLVNEHGYSRASLANLTQQQLDVLHSNAHNAARAAAPVRSSGCPGGVCPSPSRSRGLFGRRR